MSWPDVTAIKAILGITGTADDAWLTRKREVVISEIENYLERFLTKGTHVEKARFGCGCGHMMYLKGFPVESITSVRGITDYAFDRDGTFCFDCVCDAEVEVTYVGGLDPIPADIVDMFYSMLAAKYANKNVTVSSGKKKAETVPGVYSVTYFEDSGGSSSGDSDSVGYYENILLPYRLIRA